MEGWRTGVGSGFLSGGKGDGRTGSVAFFEEILDAPDQEDPGGGFVEIAEERDDIGNFEEEAAARIEQDDKAENGQENHADFFEHGIDLREKWGGVEVRNSE